MGLLTYRLMLLLENLGLKDANKAVKRNKINHR